MASDREDLIRQLAKSYGMTGEKREKEDGAKYDPASGTIFTNGKMYTLADLEQAEEYCRNRKKALAEMNDKGADYMEIAEAAIKLLTEKASVNGRRVVIKNKDQKK